jgi:hypothetical protein
MYPKTISPTYAEALEIVGKARPKSFAIFGQFQPNLLIDESTQTRLFTATSAMMLIGRGPGDFPVTQFDKPITFHKLTTESIEWLEKSGLNPRREFAPLASEYYAYILGGKETAPVTKERLNEFFGILIECLLVETQILVAKQYYHGMGLYQKGDSNPVFGDAFPNRVFQQELLYKLGELEIDQLHGRIFLEYCAVMIRAQWDKLALLQSMVFDVSISSNKISKIINAIESKLKSKDDLHYWTKRHSLLFLEIAKERVSENSWLKSFRDPLMHSVGRHSSGVIPQNKSIETTSQMWDKVCDEHNELREGMFCLLASLISRNAKPELNTK